jgi:outer membrane protein TolC
MKTVLFEQARSSAIVALLNLSFCGLVLAEDNISYLEFEQAVAIAQQNDPWLQANVLRENSLRSLSVSANTLPNPAVSVSLANLPTDSWDFGQEAMSQFNVRVSQTIPRGDSRELRSAQLNVLSDQHPLQRLDRQAQVAMTTALLWLDIYRAQQSIALIKQDRGLFEQLVDVVNLNYSSATGQTRQQDLVRAQLELTSLDDRLTVLELNRRTAQARLSEWVGDLAYLDVAASLPEIPITQADTAMESIEDRLVRHPKILALDERIRSSDLGVSLAEQEYKPMWSVNASYGYRDQDLLGNSRADLFSVGIGFDLPLFTLSRQDKAVESAIFEREAILTDRHLALRELRAGYELATQRADLLEQRLNIYDSQLLEQMSEQAESSLNGYTNDDGDFAEVVRSYIAELNAQIERLSIAVDLNKSQVEINYYLSGSAIQRDPQSVAFGESQ